MDGRSDLDRDGGCVATTAGPAGLRCCRTDPHARGHLWIGWDVLDGTHDDGPQP